MAQKPNILLIVIDCLRSDRTFGAERTAKTPNLHALADQGTVFTDLITANSMTIPCMTTMFSGAYPQKHGVRAMVGSRVSDDIPLLAEIMQANGYNTYAEATGPLSTYYHLDRGFDHYEVRDGVQDSLLGAWGDDLIDRFRTGAFAEPFFAYIHLWGVRRPRQVLPAYNTPEFGRTEYDRAISSYDARLGELFAAIGYDNTITLVTGDHGEKVPENEMEAQLEGMKKALSGRMTTGKNGRWAGVQRKAVASARETWFSMTRMLHRVGVLDSPLATMTGHGYHVYDSLVRVPLIVSGYAGLPTGEVIDDQVRQIDIAPTILELAGLVDDIPTSFQGRSLETLIDGGTLDHLPAFIETCQNSREPSDFYGVRYQGWKYAYDASNPKVAEELYDLSADPQEANNIAAANPRRAAELRALIEQHLQQDHTGGVALTDDLSDDEMAGLADHLRKLGYVE